MSPFFALCSILSDIKILHISFLLSFTILTTSKCTIQGHPVHPQYCAIITTFKFQNILIIPKSNLVPPSTHSYPRCQRLITTNMLLISTDLPVLDILREGIVHCVTFCVWLLSLSTMFSKSVLVAACARALLLFRAERCSAARTGHFYCALLSWRTFRLSPPFGLREQRCCGHLCTSFRVDVCFHFSWVDNSGVELLGHMEFHI